MNLKDIPTNELNLEIALRRGPRFRCQGCRAFHDSPGKWDTCPSCGRKGYLCGSFVKDIESAHWKDWEQRTSAYYRRSTALATPERNGE